MRNLTLLLFFLPAVCLAQMKTFVKINTAIDNYNLVKAEKLLEKKYQPCKDWENPDEKCVTYQFLRARLAQAKSNYRLADTLFRQVDMALNKTNLWSIAWQNRNYHVLNKIYQKEYEQADTLLLHPPRVVKYLPNKDKRRLYNQALIMIDEGEYAVADSLLYASLFLKRASEPPAILPIQTLYRLGECQMLQKEFVEADSLFRLALQLIDLDFSDNLIEKSIIYNLQGRLLREQNKLTIALEKYNQAESIIKELLGEQHYFYGRSLGNRGKVFLKMGKLAAAETDLLIAFEVYKNVFGEAPPLAFIADGLQDLYKKLGQENKALKYALLQKDIYLNANLLLDYARIANNMAYAYKSQDNYEEAISLVTEAISKLEFAEKTENKFYALLHMNLASMNSDLKNYDAAEISFIVAKNQLKALYGDTHPWFAATINNLATLYERTGNYLNAKDLYFETQRIDSTTLGTKHPYYIHTLYKLANIHALTNEPAVAFDFYKKANTGQIDLIYNYYSGFDEQTRLDYLQKTEKFFDRFYSFALDYHQEIPEVATEVQRVSLATKNLALDFSINNQNLANSIPDSTMAAIYQRFLVVKKQLAKAYIQSADKLKKSGISLVTLESEAELLEKELIRSKALTVGQLGDHQRPNLNQLSTSLATDAATIDFLRFNYLPADRNTDSTFYIAIVNFKHLVSLGEEQKLRRMLRSNVRQSGSNYVERQRIGYDLYQQIWQPVEPFLKNKTTVNITASGYLHKVAFAALPTTATGSETLLQQHQFTYLGNLKDLQVADNELVSESKAIVLFGGIQYDLDTTFLRQNESVKNDTNIVFDNKKADSNLVLRADSTRSGVVFNYLPGTEQEVQQIARSFNENDWTTQILKGENATEEYFKKLTSANVLHLATHGYFFPFTNTTNTEPTNARGRIQAAKNPLIRSGLALADANYAWKMGKSIAEKEDGILTAYEIANCQLQQTDLVVLSACETALGDVRTTEGVFGLQRAFKTAGVEELVISLWKVPDVQTNELMVLFYDFYLKNGDAALALYKAQLEMAKRYSAYYWAGVVLLR